MTVAIQARYGLRRSRCNFEMHIYSALYTMTAFRMLIDASPSLRVHDSGFGSLNHSEMGPTRFGTVVVGVCGT